MGRTLRIPRRAEPSFKANYARGRGSSANPDLWPTYGWSPRLGVTGNVVHEINRGAVMTMGAGMSASTAWEVDEKGHNLTSDGSENNSLATVGTFAQGNYPAFTLFAEYKQDSYVEEHRGIFGRSSANDVGKINLENVNNSNRLRLVLRGASNFVIVQSDVGDYFDGNWHAICGVRSADGSNTLYVDGVEAGSSATNAGDVTCAVATAWQMCSRVTDELVGSVGTCLFYDWDLNSSQIRRLSNDPLAPLRLKPRVYSMPV